MYQSFAFCLAPLSSFRRLMPTTLGTPANMVAILVRPSTQTSGSNKASPKKPLPSVLLQHQPGPLSGRWSAWTAVEQGAATAAEQRAEERRRKKREQRMRRRRYHFRSFGR